MYKLLAIPAEGAPKWIRLPEHMGRSSAIRRGEAIINEDRAKVVLVYRHEKPTQLLVYRPKVYVHVERI